MRRGVLEPGQGDVGREFPLLRRQAEPLADAFDLPLESLEIGRGRGTGPYRMRLLLAESADTGQGERE